MGMNQKEISDYCRKCEDQKLNDYLNQLDEQDIYEQEEDEEPNYNEDEEDR